MDRTVTSVQFANGLAYDQLPPPSNDELSNSGALDEDAIRQENAREFYRFELALPVVSGAYEQVKQYAIAEQHLGDAPKADAQDDKIWSLEKIKTGMADEAARCASQIPSTSAPRSASVVDEPVEKISQYAELVFQTGIPDKTSGYWLLPNPRELIDTVARKAGLNGIIERLIYGWSRSSSATTASCNEIEQQSDEDKVGANILYDFLISRDGCNAEHRALLKLSDYGMSEEGQVVYDMFLSCCKNDKPRAEQPIWHKTTCTHDSTGPPFHRENSIKICSEIKTARDWHIPLRLSFNDQKLWLTPNKPDQRSSQFLARRDESATLEALENLLQNGDLHGAGKQERLKKSRLAYQLALSLHALCVGPWLQEPLSANSVQILHDAAITPMDRLDEVYISCSIGQHRQELKPLPRVPREPFSEKCPEFFLSLAQLLLDIERGKRGHRPCPEDPLDEWFEILYKEVARPTCDAEFDLWNDYWRAIEGCLLYSINCKTESLLGPPDEKRLIREVIRKTILLPLQDHLEKWEAKEGAYGFSAASDDTERSISTSSHEDHTSQFILWGENDDNYKYLTEEQVNDMEPGKGSVTAHMKAFIDRYIDTEDSAYQEATGKEKVCRKVRIAVIDTGITMNDLDPILGNPDIKDRIIDTQNFFIPRGETEADSKDWKDNHGHGTHVARLLLDFAPQADIIVAKISNSKKLAANMKGQLLEALKWAGDNADIINLSFSLGSLPGTDLKEQIKKLVHNNKLIFAAASNAGGNSSRPWPANQAGVFCVHATDEYLKVDAKMNIQPQGIGDNFATLGCGILSHWEGKYVSISGTSFAAPVAAAMAANILEYARRNLSARAAQFEIFGNMRTLFRYHMTENSRDGFYHYVKPWKGGLWDQRTSEKDIRETLEGIWSGTSIATT